MTRHPNPVTRDDQRLQDDSNHQEELDRIFDGETPPPAAASPANGGGIDTTTRTSTAGVRPGDAAAERDQFHDALAATSDAIDGAAELARRLDDDCKRAAATIKDIPLGSPMVMANVASNLFTLGSYARDIERRLTRLKDNLP